MVRHQVHRLGLTDKMWIRVAALVLLAVGFAQAGAKNRMTTSLMDACFPIMPMEKLNYQPERDMQIFTDFEFTCAGEIAAWNFYAGHKGSFYASVWRKHPSGSMELIGKNLVEADKVGQQTYFIPRHLRFRVNTGDVLGVHYEDKKGRSVIMLEDDTKKNVDPTVKLSTSISIANMYDSELPHGHQFTPMHTMSINGKSAPSLFPVFNRNRLRLDGGKNPLEGRAMFRANGEWGTICDAYFVERGWPDVFCKELGYDHCELSKFARKMYVGAGKGNIGYQKPACPLTGNIFMDECGKDKGTCGHHVDVFVRCAYAVRLDDGKSADQGRAMSYKNRKWGSICDKNKKMTTNAWASALCNEIGYSHAESVEKASKTYVGKATGIINLKTPTCQADMPYQLKHCAKEGAKCEHSDDVFVKCQRGVRLSHGRKENEGIAEVYMNGRWGSVCLDTVRRGMFPSVFCKELGYDRAASVKYARNAYTGQGTGAVNEMNPECNPENAANVLNCGHPKKTGCGHNKDIFIECANNDLCKSNPCQNGAICIDMENDYKCECTEGFTGPSCEEDIDECTSSPCKGGGKCINIINGFKCACPKDRTGTLCDMVRLSKNPSVTIRSFNEPTQKILISQNKFLKLSKAASVFKIVKGLNGKQGTVSFQGPTPYRKFYITSSGEDLIMKSGQHLYSRRAKSMATFTPEESKSHPNNFILRSTYKKDLVIRHNNGRLLTARYSDRESFLATALFNFHDLDTQNAIVLYKKKDFRGHLRYFSEDDSDLGNHGFSDKMTSFEIHGSSSWELFQGLNFDGKSVVASPGRYNMDWVRSHIGDNKVSSVRKVEIRDGLTLWEKEFNGDYVNLVVSMKDIMSRLPYKKVQSIEVSGPSSWELYSEKNFKGTKIVVAPGRFPSTWLSKHLNTADKVLSVRQVEINKPMCSASSGFQQITGNSGAKHDVFVSHRQDGSVWLRFGTGNMGKTWNKKNNDVSKMDAKTVTDKEIAAMKDFSFLGFEVQTDVNFQMSVDNSWHPSKVNVMYLGSKVKETLSFKDTFSDRTDITFSADKSQLECTGRVKDGKVLSNLCGQNGLPEYGSTTNDLVITSFDMLPRGVNSYAQNKDFSRNAFTWDGTHYYVYAKLAECASSTGCYKREKEVSYVFEKMELKKDNRPDTFYFGQMGEDVDKCEAACKDEPDCVAYTLFMKGDQSTQGGCYGVGKSELADSVGEEGTVSGAAVKCGSFIPEYMNYDMWTKNSTGCPCKYDTSRTDCACCHEGACQCEHRYKYQCTLCGFGDRCGSPFLTTVNDEYIFEYTNQQLSEVGQHYKVPELCVKECHMDVRGVGSAASEIAAYMTDINDNRVLSCVASNLDKSTSPIAQIDGATTSANGVSISRINLYAFGGLGEMVQLRLKVNKEGCPSEPMNARYVGCFAKDAKLENDNSTQLQMPVFSSSHMSRASCIKHCYAIGYAYSMLEMGTTCKCSHKTPAAGPSFTCDTFCSGDSQVVCGGNSAYSVFQTHLMGHMIIVAAAPGQCEKVGGTHVAAARPMATGDNCHKITGAATSGSDIIECPIDMCMQSKIGGGGLFPARPGSCGDRKKGETFFRTIGADCLNLGGSPDYQQTEWGLCKLDVCTSDIPRSTIYTPVPSQTCPAFKRLAEVEIIMTPADCRSLHGAVRTYKMTGQEQTYCQFDMCMQDKSLVQNNGFTFSHKNEIITKGAEHFFSLPDMCVTECELSFKGTNEGASIAGFTLLGDEKKEAGLFCGGNVDVNQDLKTLSFADKATGVMVSGLQISARNNSFELGQLILRTNPDGCKGNENIMVLYDRPHFGGRPQVIRDNIGDLETVSFNNKASSFKIFGQTMWEMFENKDFMGRSAVLSAGEYYDTSVLPFEDNDLSSVHTVETLNANMDNTRKEISNARGLVCFKRAPKSSAVFGLPPNSPGGENRPNVYFFGNFGNNIDRCERACRDEPQCAAFTLFSLAADGALKDWRGLCYGRSFRDDVQVYQEDVMSGYVAACAEEDTLTLFTEKEYTGANLTIIEDTVNVTLSPGPFSAMVTGKDSWRVITESDGHIHTYKLAPGDYSDLSATFVGKVFQVSKMHPNTQLYKSQHNQIDLAPVAFNQISKTITKIRTKITDAVNKTTTTVCNTTKEAEVFFVLDASSSVFDYNYEKMLDFVANVADSFALGVDKVRVGVLIYSYYTHLDIKLGEHTDMEALQKSIDGLTYYGGGTYTHSALQALREEGLNDDNVREGVSKQAIVITDGESRRPQRTSDQAHLCRDAGIVLTAVGIKGANYEELHNIAGDASRVYNVTDFDKLKEIITAIEQTTCTAVEQGNAVWNETEHVTITVQGNDTNYFVHEDNEFHRKPVPLGMESGVIYHRQIFASSALFGHEAYLGRLNHNSGWKTTIGNHTNKNEWIEIDLGKILPIHGISTQGHGIEASWVTKYKIAISLDGIHFVTFKDTNTTMDLIFIGNTDQGTIKYHCLHRLFGQAIMARVIRFIVVEWHVSISMRIELYGFRDADDSQLVETLRKDVWTRNVTGCPCYFDSSRKDCACCEDGGCQCPNTDRHQCVQCGYPHMCGIPNLRNPVNNIDGWTSSLSGCRCTFDPLRTDCACCQSYGCQCGGGNKNQCVNCGHPEHCGLKEHIFGPNPYCKPETCPKKINTIWEGPAPHGVNPGDSNPVVQEVESQPIKLASSDE